MMRSRHKCIPENETPKLAGGDRRAKSTTAAKSETQRPSRKPGIGPPRADFQPSLEKSYRTRTDWLGREDSNLGMFVTGAFVFAAACAAIFRSIARARGDRRLVEQAPDQPRRLDVRHWALRGFVFRLGRRLSGKLLLDCLHGPDDGPLGRAAALGGVGDLGP